MWAARNGHVDCVTALCQWRSSSSGSSLVDAVNDNGSTALMVAATCGHAVVIAALAHAGADLHASTAHNGSTALHLASSCGNRAAVEQLVARVVEQLAAVVSLFSEEFASATAILYYRTYQPPQG